MPGKNSKARYRAMLQDVENRVDYAFSSGKHVNPYDKEDKRFSRFEKALQRILWIDSDFRDMHEIYGGDVNDLQKRKVKDPGPVKSVDDLIKPSFFGITFG